jgi:hypothetical protein
MWRALKALGAAVFCDGVYVLPKQDEFPESPLTQSGEAAAVDGIRSRTTITL